MKRRVSKKEIDALADAIDFITTNSDGVESIEDKKYFRDLNKRLNKIWRILIRKNL